MYSHLAKAASPVNQPLLPVKERVSESHKYPKLETYHTSPMSSTPFVSSLCRLTSTWCRRVTRK